MSFRFDAFLERILYHPRHGYYSRVPSFGKHGDFYTSPGVHSFFAEILAEQFLQLWEESGKPRRFTLLELGPGDAELALQLLTASRRRFPDFHSSIRYLGLELCVGLAGQQSRRLSQFENASIICSHFSETQLEPFNGCIFSNEFFDALPFRRFRRARSGWLECFVDITAGSIQERWSRSTWKPALAGSGKQPRGGNGKAGRPAKRGSVRVGEWGSWGSRFDEHRARTGDYLEWRQFEDFYEFASSVLRQGAMFHFDYGEVRENLDPLGTMRTYHRHRLGTDPYVQLGEQDVTASVDFSHLMSLGQKLGFENRLEGQRRYLIERGILEKIAVRFEGEAPEKQLREKLAVKNLIVPGGISDHFKVLIQRKV